MINVGYAAALMLTYICSFQVSLTTHWIAEIIREPIFGEIAGVLLNFVLRASCPQQLSAECRQYAWLRQNAVLDFGNWYFVFV
jgi:hypothetical protein